MIDIKEMLLIILLIPLTAQSIVGGQSVEEGSLLERSTVSIHDGIASFCTGSVISNDLVLTAAHCISEMATSDLYITYGVTAGDNKLYRVTKFKYIYLSNLDLALLATDKELPLTPVNIGDPENLKIGNKLIQVGYGFTVDPDDDHFDFANTDLGHLNYLNNNTLLYFFESEIFLNKHNSLLHRGLRVLEQYETRTVEGDSGGPLYSNHHQELKLYGILHGGLFNNDTIDSTYTQPYHLISWMNCALPKSKQLNSYPTLKNQIPCDGIPLKPITELKKFNNERCMEMRPGYQFENEVYGCWPATEKTCAERAEHIDGLVWDQVSKRCIDPETEKYLNDTTN